MCTGRMLCPPLHRYNTTGSLATLSSTCQDTAPVNTSAGLTVLNNMNMKSLTAALETTSAYQRDLARWARVCAHVCVCVGGRGGQQGCCVLCCCCVAIQANLAR